MITGIDTAARITAVQAAKIKAEGLSYVGRYLVPESYGKALTAAEAAALRASGLGILLCWETTGDRVRGGASAGASDGFAAHKLAEALGVPAGACIFFAVDYAPAVSEYDTIEAYLCAARRNLEQYRCGVYGNFSVVEAMTKRGACERAWQCCGGSGGLISVHADVMQYEAQNGAQAKKLARQLGFAVDLNSCEDLRGAGIWCTDPAPAPWYAETMAWAEKEGIASDGRPEDFATRAEVLQMIRNYNRRFEEEDPANDSGILSD